MSACSTSIDALLQDNSCLLGSCTLEKVLMRRNVRDSKYDPLAGAVDLLKANPQYAHVKLAEGWKTTVSTKQLAQARISCNKNINIFHHINHAQGIKNVCQITEYAITIQNVKVKGKVQCKAPVKRYLQEKKMFNP